MFTQSDTSIEFPFIDYYFWHNIHSFASGGSVSRYFSTSHSYPTSWPILCAELAIDYFNASSCYQTSSNRNSVGRNCKKDDASLIKKIASGDVLVKFLDASWFMPNERRNCYKEFIGKGHIPRSSFFDIDKTFTDEGNPIPHMLPTPERFADGLTSLGVTKDTMVICYDSSGLFSAPRAWWMLRVFGHHSHLVWVLDGGLPAWIRAGGPIEVGESVSPFLEPYPHPKKMQEHLLWRLSDITRLVNKRAFDMYSLVDKRGEGKNDEQLLPAKSNAVILDARSHERFHGISPEPRQGIPSGHIPFCSRNLPYKLLVTDDGKLRSVSALRDIFTTALENEHKPVKIVASCGTGVTACIVALAGARLGQPNIAIFDGSWTEYASVPNQRIFKTPINIS